MGFYIIVILAEIVFWWRLRSDYSTGPEKLWGKIRLVKMLLTLLLVFSFIRILFLRGDIALPQNAFSLIFFGAVATMTIVAGSFYVIFSHIRLLFIRLFKKPLNGFKWTNTIVTTVIIVLFFYGYAFGRFNIKTEKQDIFLDCQDRRIDGMKIAFISDLHLSSFENHYSKLGYIISEINTNRPDIVLNAGDFITYGWQEFGRIDTILRKVNAPLGSFAVSGNHDDCSYDKSLDLGRQSDGALLVDSLIRSSGYTLLDDTSATVVFNGAKVAVAGIRTTGHHLNIKYGNETRALSGIPDSSLVIFLVHDPAYWGKSKNIQKAADITLSGHTHGMQAGIPFPWGRWSPASFFHKYWGGLYESKGHYLYVNRGMGCMAMAERIFMPPEITIITLHCK